VILRSHEAFETLAEFDLESGCLSLFSRKGSPEQAADPVAGIFGHVGGALILLFRLGKVLYLECEGLQIPLTEARIELLKECGNRRLRVSKNGTPVWSFDVEIPENHMMFENDPTPGVEAEDFDYALFLRNVSADAARQSRLFSGQS
jgi:hypothetical protein